ncbi:MAG: hypothetical protein QW251_03675 [Desulfurococcaceae archaeon]
MSWAKDFFNTRLGKVILGIIKLSLAQLVIALMNSISLGPDPVISGITIPVNTMFNVIRAFAGILLIISGLRDLGVF